MNILNKLAGVALCALSLTAMGEIDAKNIKSTGSVDVKLMVFECGDLTILNANNVDPTRAVGETAESASPCYLIKHPDGMLMWDTGLDDGLIDKPKGKIEGGGSLIFKVKTTLASQFEEANINPKKIEYIAFSHMHLDHTGNAKYFDTATWLVQKKELKVAKGGLASLVGFVKRDYQDLIPRAQGIDGNYDVFGDGSVVIISTPGHTVGHQVLFVDLPKTKAVILSGDMVVSAAAWEQRSSIESKRSKKAKASLELVEKVMQQTGANLWVQHDKPQFDKLQKAPYVYE